MAKTLLQMINAAQNELGLPTAATTSVIGNSDPTTVQLLALLNESGEELRDYPEGGWTSMYSEFNLVVSPPVEVTGNLTANSGVITGMSSTVGISAGSFAVSGSSIPQSARVLSVDSATQITMTMEAIGAATATDLVFAQDTYAMPSDFKYYQNRTYWDRTNHWELLGPDSPQMDQWHRSGIVATGPRRHFRNIGHATNTFRLWPPPAEIVDPLQLVFEYISTNWVNVSGTNVTTASSFQGDTDTSYLDDRALIKWVKWKFWQIKGFGYDVLRNDAIDFVNTLVGRDGGAQTLSLVKRVNPIFISPANVQDGFFPGPTGPNMS